MTVLLEFSFPQKWESQNPRLLGDDIQGKTMKLKLLFLLVLISANSWLSSTTWHIKQDGTGNFTTIQEGIDASSDSDTVLVYTGTYYENIDYLEKSLTVASLYLITPEDSLINQTIIDGIDVEDKIRNPQYNIPYQGYWSDVVNFVLSDGENLYVFRNGNDSWNHHLLSWEENSNNCYTVKTQSELSNSINQFDFVTISRDDAPIVYNDFFDIDIKSFYSGVDWTSFPRIGIEPNNNEPTDIVPILGAINPFNDITDIVVYYNNNQDPVVWYDDPEGWTPGNYDAKSSYLYKIEIQPEEERTLIIDGERLPADYSFPDTEPLVPDIYHWLGYWLPESQNIVNAFGTGENGLWQYVEKVKAEDWYYDKCIPERGFGDPIPKSWVTTGKTMEYGKGYMVMFIETPPITDFHWTESGESEEPVKKATSESFTYTEKSDYEVIDVIDIPANVNEIGVFEDDQCVGAVVVQDSCAQILVYSDNANRDPIPFNFEIVTGRGVSSSISDYKVFNQITGEFEPGIVISGMQEYSIIRFGEEGELEDNIPSVTKLHSNYPNPFNPSTTISFSLPKEENIELTIYNIKGQKVKTLYSGSAEEGKHTMIWEGKDTNDKLVSSGLYFYQLKTKDKELTRKMLLLK